jgi:hypothetical protein
MWEAGRHWPASPRKRVYMKLTQQNLFATPTKTWGEKVSGSDRCGYYSVGPSVASSYVSYGTRRHGGWELGLAIAWMKLTELACNFDSFGFGIACGIELLCRRERDTI